jgi:hypothetical protein
MKIKHIYLLMALLSMPTGSLAAEADPDGFKPGTIVRPTNPITGKVDRSKPYLKADDNGVLKQHNTDGRRIPGAGFKKVGDKIYQTNPITGRVDHSKPQLKIIPPSQ